MKRTVFILLYGLLTPLLLLGLANTRLFENIGEAVRPDDYSMGLWYYLILFGTLALLNSILILIVKKFPPVNDFFVTLLLSLVASLIGTVSIILIFGLLFIAGMMHGH